MKIFGKEIPPRINQQEEVIEDTLSNPEAQQAKEEAITIYNNTSERASSASLFSLPEKRELFQKRAEIEALAEELSAANDEVRKTELLQDLHEKRNEMIEISQTIDTKINEHIQSLSNVEDQHSEAEKAKEDVDTFYTDWSKRALEADLFFSPEKRALAASHRAALELVDTLSKTSDESQKTKLLEELKDKMEEMNNVSHGLEAAIEANKKRIYELRNATSSEKKTVMTETVGEIEFTRKMAAAGSKMEIAQAAVRVEQEAVDAAEAVYLEKYKEFYSKRGAKEKKEPEELKQLKSEYNQKRAEYLQALQASAVKRLDAKESNIPTSSNAEVLKRYNRIVRFREVVKPAAEKIYQAKVEAMGQREKGIFSKALYWVGGKNKALEERFGKNGSRFVRAAATTLVVGGGAAAAGAFGTAGILGALGWGTYRFGRSLASSFAGAAIGETVAQTYAKVYGNKKQARTREQGEKGLKSVGRSKIDRNNNEIDLTVDDLEYYDTQRRELLEKATSTSVEREKIIARVLAGFATGAITSGILSELPSARTGISELANASLKDYPVDTDTYTPGELKTPIYDPNEFTVSSVKPLSTAFGGTAEVGKVPESLPTTAPSSPSIPVEHPIASKVPVEYTPKIVREFAPSSKAVPVSESVQSAEPRPEIPPVISSEPISQFTRAELPAGMETNSPEATAWLNNHYNQSTPETTGAPSVSETPTEFPAKIQETPVATEIQSSAAPQPESMPATEPTQPSVKTPTSVGQHEPLDTSEVPDTDTTSYLNRRFNPEVFEHSQETPVSTPEAAPTAVDLSTQTSTPSSGAEIIDSHSTPTNQEIPVQKASQPETITVTGTAEGVVTNKHGLVVDQRVAHIYGGKSKDIVTVWGGTTEQKFAAIDKFYSDPSNLEKKIALVGKPDPKTGKVLQNIYESYADGSKQIEFRTIKPTFLERLFTSRPIAKDVPNVDDFRSVVL